MATVNLAASYYLRRNAPWAHDKGALITARRPGPPHGGTLIVNGTLTQIAAGTFGRVHGLGTAMAVARRMGGQTYVTQLKSSIDREQRHAGASQRGQSMIARGTAQVGSRAGSRGSSGNASIAAAADDFY